MPNESIRLGVNLNMLFAFSPYWTQIATFRKFYAFITWWDDPHTSCFPAYIQVARHTHPGYASIGILLFYRLSTINV
jgi:hypothetical protein